MAGEFGRRFWQDNLLADFATIKVFGQEITFKHKQKKLKTEQKTGQLQCKKRKKTTTEEITPEHKYKASKKKPGNSGPTRD